MFVTSRKPNTVLHQKVIQVLEHPLNLVAMGGASVGTGWWVITTKVLTISTLIASFIAALCGAVTGVVGVCLVYRKWKNGTLFKEAQK